jgi:DNA-directed RNA polymerase specialized sigma24 family protein
MLELLSKYQNEWVAMSISIGIPRDLVDDIIQDMYIKVYNAHSNGTNIMYNDTEPNKYYVYITLRNLYYDLLKKEKSFVRLSYLDDLDKLHLTLDEFEPNELESLEKIIKNIDEEVSSWTHWYDRKLFKAYYKTDLSMRDLSKSTGISLTSIFNSCRRYKVFLQEKFGEDYDDFLNKDYDKI